MRQIEHRALRIEQRETEPITSRQADCLWGSGGELLRYVLLLRVDLVHLLALGLLRRELPGFPGRPDDVLGAHAGPDLWRAVMGRQTGPLAVLSTAPADPSAN